MIRTRETRIPWFWVFIMVLPACADRMVGMISQSFIAWTLHDRFTEDPALIMFFSSVNTVFNILVGPFVAWKSDRIWTRFGRRKPFLVIGWLAVAFFVSLIPYASGLFMVAFFIVAYNFFMDFVTGGALEPLTMEVVPQPQRGRMSAMRKLVVLITALIVNLTLMRVWDYNYVLNLGLFSWRISGEQITYHAISFMLLAVMILVAFGVKEVRPEKIPDLNEKFALGAFFSGIFRDRQQLKIYSLVFAIMAMNMGMGSLGALLLTEQFGYKKADVGELYAGLKIFQIIFFVPLAGFLADRVDRLKIFLVGITLSTLAPLSYWTWIQFVATNNIPSLTAIICFTGFDILVDFTVVIAMQPLIFDYIPKGKMGTVFAGTGMVSAIGKLILMNIVGLFVKYYSLHFCPPGVTDFSAGYLCIFAFGLFGTGCALYFMRERRLGRIIPYGKLEHEALVAARKAAKEPVESINS